MNLLIVHKRAPSQPISIKTPADAGDTRECSDCGEMNDPNAKFCDQCGERMGAGCALLCGSCGCTNDALAKCCDQCGAQLDATLPAQAGPTGPITMIGKQFPEWAAANGGGIKKVNGKGYGGYVVKFTDSEKKDLTGEWFDEETDFMLGVYPVKGIHALYDHGLDASIGAIPIGDITDVKIKPDGIWAVLNFQFEENLKRYLTELSAPDEWKKQQEAKGKRYHDMIQQMLDAGELGWSSGAHPQSVRVGKSGHIDRWPIWEASATLQPAMPFDTTIQRVKSSKPHNFFNFERA
jgi:hypothetical protein